MTKNKLRHIAIIMDGNNRWAKQKGVPGPAGHKAGVEAIRDVLSSCRRHHVDVLTLFAFSSENWQRPEGEVGALMSLFLHYLRHETKKLKKEGVRLHIIGRRDRFSPRIIEAINDAEALTEGGTAHLVIAADYGGQWDIANAARRLADKVASGDVSPDQIDESLFHQHMALSSFPMPDMLIRTGGEIRISNFLLWQSAYTELYFSDLFWPDFDGKALDIAIADYYQRQRRFGLSGDQMTPSKKEDPCA